MKEKIAFLIIVFALVLSACSGEGESLADETTVNGVYTQVALTLSAQPTSPLNPNHPGNAIKDVLQPRAGEPLIQKNVNSAFIGTDLEKQLRTRGCNSLVIVGLTTPHCVSTTSRMAGNLGFVTYLVSDATAAFALTGHDGRRYSAQEIHDVTLATLNGEFATVVETNELL